jgi:hypothetical protein
MFQPLLLSSLLLAKAPPTPTAYQDPNPLGRFQAKKGIGMYISGEALLLKVTEDDLPVAILSNTPTTSNADIGVTYNTEYLHDSQKWKWGFRAKLGWHLDHDGWDLQATYTRFYSYTDKLFINYEPKSYHLIAQAQNYSTNNITPDEAVLFRWSVRFNQWDVDQSRMFYVSRYLRVEPLLGLRNLILGQTFTTTIDQNKMLYQSKTTVHFWGMGVIGGLNTYWGLNRQFTIYGGLKLSSLFGHFHPHMQDGISFPQNFVDNSLDKQKSSKSCLDLSLGVQWDKMFYNDKWHLGINVGFEQHTYFNMNKSFFSYAQAEKLEGLSGRDFCLQGFSFGLRSDF